MTYLKWLQSLVGGKGYIVSTKDSSIYTFQFILQVHLNNVKPLDIIGMSTK